MLHNKNNSTTLWFTAGLCGFLWQSHKYSLYIFHVITHASFFLFDWPNSRHPTTVCLFWFNSFIKICMYKATTMKPYKLLQGAVNLGIPCPDPCKILTLFVLPLISSPPNAWQACGYMLHRGCFKGSWTQISKSVHFYNPHLHWLGLCVHTRW